jgi:hypothetical protein
MSSPSEHVTVGQCCLEADDAEDIPRTWRCERCVSQAGVATVQNVTGIALSRPGPSLQVYPSECRMIHIASSN